MTSAVLGSGATLQLGDGASPQVYATVAEVLRCGEIGSTNQEVDVTNLDSTAKEYIPGLADGNTFEFEFNYTQGTSQVSLRTQQQAGATVHLQMVWPNSPQTSVDFDCVLLGWSMNETTAEAQMTATVTGRISGTPTWVN